MVALSISINKAVKNCY